MNLLVYHLIVHYDHFRSLRTLYCNAMKLISHQRATTRRSVQICWLQRPQQCDHIMA